MGISAVVVAVVVAVAIVAAVAKASAAAAAATMMRCLGQLYHRLVLHTKHGARLLQTKREVALSEGKEGGGGLQACWHGMASGERREASGERTSEPAKPRHSEPLAASLRTYFEPSARSICVGTMAVLVVVVVVVVV